MSIAKARSKTLIGPLICLVCMVTSAPVAHAGRPSGQATTTGLSLSASSVINGAPVTLTATVHAGASAVTAGTVLFCDAAAALCADTALLGSAQLTSSGTATRKLRFGVGSYSIKAEFQKTNSDLSSVSSAQALNVTGNASYASTTTITSSGSAGNYTLASTVTTVGKAAMAGTMAFLDTSNANLQIAAATFDPATTAYAFAPAVGSPYAAGAHPSAVVAGDFNNDGILDLAVVNENDNTVGVFLGNADGTFAAQVTYATGSTPTGLAVGDFNGDGRLDLVATNYSDDTISVLIGNGDGTFQSQALNDVSINPVGVTVGDFNRDGFLDIAVASYDEHYVDILLGNGDGTFQPQTTQLVSGSAYGIVAADFNGDGNLDIVTANSNQITVLLGSGDGTFQARVPYIVGSGAEFVAAGDFNGDGKPDLAVTNSGDNTISILLGNGDGTFQTQVTYATGFFPLAIAVGDFNQDGKLDLVNASEFDDSISVLLGNGDGTFQAQTEYSSGDNAYSVVVGDFNGDGLADIGVANQGDNDVSSLLNIKSASATATGVSVFGSGTHNVVASYPGDASRAASQSSTVPLTAVAPVPTATALTGAPNPAFFQQSVTFTATVTLAPTGFTLGSVTFYRGATLLGIVAMNPSGTVMFATSSLPAGADGITAVYLGSPGYLTSTSSAFTETVSPLSATATSLTSAPNPAGSGATVTFTATVSPAPTGASLGTVSFYNGSTLLGTTNINSAGVATFTIKSLPTGADGITAVYSGNATSGGSTSTAVSETIYPTYNVTVPQTPATVAEGGSVQVPVTIPPVGGTFNGLVTLSASGLPSGATASFTPPAVTPGSTGGATVMTVQLKALAARAIDPRRRIPFTSLAFAMGLCGIGWRGKRLARGLNRTRISRTKLTALTALVLACATWGLTSCSAGFLSPANTKPGSYIVTITGTSRATHVSTTVTLVVQ